MAQSAFDSNAFLETSYKGGLDTSYVLPDPGDYQGQITDKIVSRVGLVGDGKERAGETWASIDIQWEILDDNMKQKLNSDHVFVRQSIMLDLMPGSTPDRPVLDFGTNKNMRLRRLIDATGLNKQKAWNIPMLKHQTGLIHVEHRRIEGFDDDIAEVTRVTAFNGHG